MLEVTSSKHMDDGLDHKPIKRQEKTTLNWSSTDSAFELSDDKTKSNQRL